MVLGAGVFYTSSEPAFSLSPQLQPSDWVLPGPQDFIHRAGREEGDCSNTALCLCESQRQ